MVAGGRLRILTINAGSSSLKTALYDMDRTERLTLACQVERIGQSGGMQGTALNRLVNHEAGLLGVSGLSGDMRDLLRHGVPPGIGEHSAPIRERICKGLEFLGLELDGERNARHAPIVSRDGSRVVVRVMKTDEDLMIARHARQLLSAR